jgi:hypothetical protein
MNIIVPKEIALNIFDLMFFYKVISNFELYFFDSYSSPHKDFTVFIFDNAYSAIAPASP